MSTISPPFPQTNSSARTANAQTFENAQEWHHALGDVPLERIVFNPLPGTATEKDLLEFVARRKRLVELVDGTLVEKAMGYEEAWAAAIILNALFNFAIPRKLGRVTGAESTMRMVGSNVRLPDIVFVTEADFQNWLVKRDAIAAIPPSLAVEVISGGNTVSEMKTKRKEYFESGAKMVWQVYPSTRVVEVYESDTADPLRTLKVGEMLDGGEVLPGFQLAVADIFSI